MPPAACRLEAFLILGYKTLNPPAPLGGLRDKKLMSDVSGLSDRSDLYYQAIIDIIILPWYYSNIE